MPGSRYGSLRELATNGAGDNPYVIVTDFRCAADYVFEMQRRKGAPPPGPEEAGWGRAWIPLFPKLPPDERQRQPPPTSFVVLLETTPTLASSTGFHLLSRRPSVEGLVVPLSRRGLSADVRAKLAESYPDTDFKNCLVLEQYERVHKEDASVFAYALAAGAGVGLLVGLPVFCLGVILSRARRGQSHVRGSAQ